MVWTKRIKTNANNVYKKLLVLPKPMLGAHLLASDFPSENPRTQTRNFPYTNRCQQYEKTHFNTDNLIS